MFFARGLHEDGMYHAAVFKYDAILLEGQTFPP